MKKARHHRSSVLVCLHSVGSSGRAQRHPSASNGPSRGGGSIPPPQIDTQLNRVVARWVAVANAGHLVWNHEEDSSC
ncbi:hypothetical protein TNCV_3613201 [Trichonephila clavipes]|uniref:Uncharacterized protein n=1 Tax=Trichonephila clavipes TaxID=2585209 RepID=A0A8X6SL14_TRICX|nr:hypothetical protein TNCV_3613201 [Trichonephila clavipes]